METVVSIRTWFEYSLGFALFSTGANGHRIPVAWGRNQQLTGGDQEKAVVVLQMD